MKGFSIGVTTVYITEATGFSIGVTTVYITEATALFLWEDETVELRYTPRPVP